MLGVIFLSNLLPSNFNTAVWSVNIISLLLLSFLIYSFFQCLNEFNIFKFVGYIFICILLLCITLFNLNLDVFAAFLTINELVMLVFILTLLLAVKVSNTYSTQSNLNYVYFMLLLLPFNYYYSISVLQSLTSFTNSLFNDLSSQFFFFYNNSVVLVLIAVILLIMTYVLLYMCIGLRASWAYRTQTSNISVGNIKQTQNLYYQFKKITKLTLFKWL